MKIKQVGIVSCSDPRKENTRKAFDTLISDLKGMDLIPIISVCIFENENGYASAMDRAYSLMNFYGKDDLTDIFDISGGNIANGVLPYLNYEIIKNSNTTFWGYSDLTTVINAIYAMTGKSSILYQLRNLVGDYRDRQLKDFENYLNGDNSLFDIKYDFINEAHMEGVVIGGNIRCFLKLAGTKYMPDFSDKILFLESLGGSKEEIESYLTSLWMLGAFNKVSGILLGTFSQLDRENPGIIKDMILKYTGTSIPVAVTRDVGHGADSKALVIGTYQRF